MTDPKITVLLCTVRGDAGYLNHPEWHTVGKVMEDLRAQTFQDFEFVVVDGLRGNVQERSDSIWWRPSDPPQWVRPGETSTPSVRHDSFWVKHKKVAISAYRNTGLIHARGELVVNLDDCCSLPPDYLEGFWHVWKNHGYCLAMRWPEQGDHRQDGVLEVPGQVFGFGSYPLKAAIAVNGYDESYDGGQGLEDVDFSTRLHNHGVRFMLAHLPGFKIHAQTGHDPAAIDLKDPIVKCCNVASRMAAERMRVGETANVGWNSMSVRRLAGSPCFLLSGGTCTFHGHPCAYLEKGWPSRAPHPLWEEFWGDPVNWPNFNLAAERKKVGR